MASYGGVSTSTSLGRPTSSLGIAQNNQVSGPSGQPQQQWSGSIPQGVQLPYTQGSNEIPMEQALNRVFPRGIPAAMEQYLAPNMEPDFGSFRRQSGQSSLDSVISLPELRYDVMARYPGYQVESSDMIIFSFFLEFWVGTGEGLEYFVFKCWNDMHGMHNSQCGTLLYICMYV